MVMANEVLTVLLDETGDGTGNADANVDGSSTPVVFKSIVPAGHRYAICTLRAHIADDAVIKPETYGGVSTLANGVDFQVFDTDDNAIYNIFDGHTITANNDFAGMGTLAVLDFGAGATYGISVFINLVEAYGSPLILETGQYFAATINDNLTGLTDHHFFLQGYKITSGFHGALRD